MTFNQLVKDIENSKEFKEYKGKKVLYSAFFTLRKAQSKIIEDFGQLNYWTGGKNCVVFSALNNIEFKEDTIEEKKVKEFTDLKKDIKFDIDKLIELLDKKLKGEVSKILVVLQKINQKQVWNITAILTTLEMYRIKIDMDGKILEDKKQDITDMIRIKKKK
ncbi:MAG: hypothetical protein ABH817_00445 [archaeon]